MSGKTWHAEFMPVPANDPAVQENDLTRLLHVEKKWSGYTKANLKRHGLTKERGHLNGGVGDGLIKSVHHAGADNCALCEKHQDCGCDTCPLYLVSGDTCGDGADPYSAWYDFNDVRPMLRTIRSAIFAERKAMRKKK
jgi:hypothetical protein